MARILTLIWRVKPIKPSIENTFRNTASEEIAAIGDSEYFRRELLLYFEFFG